VAAGRRAGPRRGNGRALWAHESACGRLELGKHWASLRVTHAFGQGEPGPATGATSRRKIVNAIRALSQYRPLLKRLGDTGALRVELLMQYERDQVRRIDQRVQWGLGPSVSVVDTERVRLHFTPAYVFELQRDWVPGPDTWQAHQLAWLGSELGWSIDESMFLGEEVIVQLPVERCPCAPRVYAQTNFRVRGNRWLSLESALRFMFDRGQRDLGLSRWDVVLRTGLVFTL